MVGDDAVDRPARVVSQFGSDLGLQRLEEEIGREVDLHEAAMHEAGRHPLRDLARDTHTPCHPAQMCVEYNGRVNHVFRT